MAIIESVLERQGFEEYRGDGSAELKVAIDRFSIASARFYMPFMSPMEMILLRQPAASPTSNIVVIAEQMPFSMKGKLISKRVFIVKSHLTEEFCNTLFRNNGLLDSEVERISVISSCGKYNVVDDIQASSFYDAEHSLMDGNSLRTGITSADVHNERYPTNRPEKKALNPREAKELIEEVCEDYAMPMLEVGRMPHQTTGMSAVVAMCRTPKKTPFPHPTQARSILLNETLAILRSIVLHELAHAIDIYEFGAFGHGPTFIMIYCELLHTYAGMDFEKCIKHFEARGLYVANPIYSKEFKRLSKASREHYLAEHSAFKRGLVTQW